VNGKRGEGDQEGEDTQRKQRRERRKRFAVLESGLLFARFKSGSTMYTPTVKRNSSAHSKVIQVRLDQLQHAPESMAERLRTHPPTHPPTHARTHHMHACTLICIAVPPTYIAVRAYTHVHTQHAHIADVQISPVYIHLSLLNMPRGSSTWSRICVHMSWVHTCTHTQKKQHTHTHVCISPFYIHMSSLNIL